MLRSQVCDLALGFAVVAAGFRPVRLDNPEPETPHFDWTCSPRAVHARPTCIVAVGRYFAAAHVAGTVMATVRVSRVGRER